MKKNARFLSIFIALLFFMVSPLFAYRLYEPYDHSLWDQFLKKVVNEQGQVNFQLAKENRELLESYISHFEAASFDHVDFLAHWPREERLATLLNLYHACVLRLILDHYPIRSIQDIPGGWNLISLKLGQRKLSLNNLRDELLIGEFRDEKIHTALACSAKTCPPFSREAFTGPKVEGQLYQAAKAFVNNEEYNQIIPGKKRIELSRIFKWYAKDFQLDFGFDDEENIFSGSENAVLAFFAHYLDDPKRIEFLEERRYKIKYLPFDWSLKETQVISANPS